MFDDIIKNKRKFDLDVIQKDLGDFINNFLWELMDEITLRMIKNGVDSYLDAYGLQTSTVSYNFAYKKVIIRFEKVRLEFPMVN
jgi:hypothetical protein